MAASKGDSRCSTAASPLRVRKQDGSLAQQIRRAAAAAEAEDLEELRRGLRSDVLDARRLFEEQQQAEARRNEQQAELHDSVARCRDEAAAACSNAKEHWLRFEAAQEAMACGYREGDRKLGAELLVKMSELNAKLGENMAALEAEVTHNVQLQMSSLREDLERRLRPDLAEELETKCSSLLKQAEASLAATLAEATEVSRKSFRTVRKEHEAFVLKRQKQFHGWVQECQEQLRETRSHCDGLTASALSKVEALQEQDQRRWSGELDCRLGRCEGECQALLSDARQHLQASEEIHKEWRSRGEALEHDQRAGITELRERLEKVDETVTANEKGLQSQRVLIEQLTADFQTLQDRLVVVEGAVSKQSTTVQSLRHKLHSVKEGSCTQLKELQQQITAEVSEARRMQAEGEARQAAAMEEKQQALRRHCRAWSSEAAQGAQETLSARLQEAGRWYCSRNCQEKDWKLGHKGDCGLADLPATAAVPSPPFRLLAESVERPVHTESSWRRLLDSTDLSVSDMPPRGLRNVANCCRPWLGCGGVTVLGLGFTSTGARAAVRIEAARRTLEVFSEACSFNLADWQKAVENTGNKNSQDAGNNRAQGVESKRKSATMAGWPGSAAKHTASRLDRPNPAKGSTPRSPRKWCHRLQCRGRFPAVGLCENCGETNCSAVTGFRA
eukprot:s3607_g3.t1